MAKNKYAERQMAMHKAIFQAGVKAGRQQIKDMASLVLRDPTYMRTKTFSRDSLLKFIEDINACINTYQKAYVRDPETDYYRDKMDEALQQAYGDAYPGDFISRYECSPEFDYKTGRWV